MSSFVKTKLKSARDALGKKEYETAREAATQVLEYEPGNYNANVFLGLALLELGQLGGSEQAYQNAIDSQPDQLLAWQGISKFYERTEQWDNYLETLEHLMHHFSRSNDATKTAETLQKIIDLRRERGSRSQLVNALEYLLPESSLYPVLSTLPPPNPTNPISTTTFAMQEAVHNSLPIFEEIIALTEQDEDETVKKEISKRRTRMNAPGLEELKKEVGREIWGASKLPRLYDEVLNHPTTPDDLRRLTESKLLRHKQRYLHALPCSGELSSVKTQIATEVDTLVNGAVLLGIPDELAWTIFIEGMDSASIEGYGFTSLRHFIRLFPSLPLTNLLKGYFIYIGAPLPRDDEDDGEPPTIQPGEDVFDMVLDAFTTLSGTIFATRIVAELHLREEDYQNAIRLAESGLELVRRSETDNAKKLTQVQKAFNVVLATSLVHFYPPKHHPRALGVIERVLVLDPNNTSCLMGRGYVLQYMDKWVEAGTLFAKVAQLIPEDLEIGLRAKEEHAWCQFHTHDIENGVAGLKDVLNILDSIDDRNLDNARCLWRLGKCYWEMGDNQRDDAYKCFIMALKRNSTYAPAFTSLGIYYAEFIVPPDPTRASKCFQKAFELDPREVYAARRLAEGFAEEREWDLVEVVARRTIDGEGGLDAGMKDGDAIVTGRYLPTNAWAWKAVGVVELARRNYPPAIQAFQVALRANPDEQLLWLRLGEAYSKAGRHSAALKALCRAHELSADDWICTYFIGEVHSQMGKFHDAIEAFESILTKRPSEVGVLMSLAQTNLELGRDEMTTGFLARAEQSFGACVQVAVKIIRETPGFRSLAWKTVADAIFHLSRRTSFVDADNVRALLEDVASLIIGNISDRLSGFLVLPSLKGDSPVGGRQALEVAIIAYDYRISLGSGESMTGSSWYDLGVALNCWSSQTISREDHERAKKQATECLIKALREDAGNDIFWNALGSINFVTQPKTAQHAYIKALEIDNKNVVSWTNIGLLYLYHNDLQLANEAFYRAQTLDPDYTVAWVGQGLVASANGHGTDARAIFEHAVGLTADIPEADVEYASQIFSSLSHISYGRPASYDAIFPAFFVLDRYSKRRPDDATGLHLFGLICERLGQIDLGVDLIQRAISILEAIYEETEDPLVERQFTVANSNLARLKLSALNYDGALESFESVLGLLPDDSSSPPDLILRAQAQFGSGLARFKLGHLEEALSLFEAALESAGDNMLIRGQVTVLLAQTMWAIGTDEFKESAKAQLLECITTDPENLTAINALAAMGILTDDDSLIDAALSEILSLPIERRHQLDPCRDVDYLLIQHHLGQGDTAQALSVAQHAMFTEPSLPSPKRTLASLALQQGQHDSALAVLASQTEDNLVDVRDSLALRAVAEAINERGAQAQGEAVKRAQKAVMLAPWELRNWQSLAYVRSRSTE